jgi:hypothetical protein
VGGRLYLCGEVFLCDGGVCVWGQAVCGSSLCLPFNFSVSLKLFNKIKEHK